MKKYDRKPVMFDGLNTKNHWLLGIEIPVTGSTGNQYIVELKEKGFTCTCTGFTMHGKCKHITGYWNHLGKPVPQYRMSY